MKLALSLLASIALVGAIAFTTSTTPEALPQPYLIKQRALDDLVIAIDEKLPPFLLDYLANPNDPGAIDRAWDELVPVAMDVAAPTPVDPVPIVSEGKQEQAKFDCVFVNRAGTKWCVTVTYTCKDGMVVPGNPDIADCTSGFHLPYTWSVSIDKNGKVTISINTLGIFTITTCRWAPECDC